MGQPSNCPKIMSDIESMIKHDQIRYFLDIKFRVIENKI
jgi:hypothetical protein